VIVNLQGTAQPQVVNFGGGSYIDNTLSAGNLLFLYAGAGQINFTGGSTTAAVVYTPNAAVTVSGNADFMAASSPQPSI